MWFKKKSAERKATSQRDMRREIEKEVERFDKLLQAYELLKKEKPPSHETRLYLEQMERDAKFLISIPDDFLMAQEALVTLWDAYEILETNKPKMGRYESRIDARAYARAKNMATFRCWSCFEFNKRNTPNCPDCGVPRY